MRTEQGAQDFQISFLIQGFLASWRPKKSYTEHEEVIRTRWLCNLCVAMDTQIPSRIKGLKIS